MKTYGFVLAAFFFMTVSWSSAALSSQAQNRMAEIDRELAKIQKQIDDGADPKFFNKFIAKFEKEKASLLSEDSTSAKVPVKIKPKKEKSAAVKKPQVTRKVSNKIKKTPKKVKRPVAKATPTVDMDLERYEHLLEKIQENKVELYSLKNGTVPWSKVKFRVSQLQKSLISLQRESDTIAERLGPLRAIATPSYVFSRSLASQPTPAPEKSDFAKRFKFSGHMQSRHENRNRTGYSAAVEGVTYFRLRTDWRYQVNDQVEVGLSPQATKGLGAANTGGASDSLTNHEGIDFFEAFAKYRPTQSFSVQLGRQALSYGDDLIIGALPWANNGRSFDAARATVNHGEGHTDIFVSQVTDNGTTNTHEDDTVLSGIYSQLGTLGFAEAVDLYYLNLDLDASNVRVNTLGLRLKGSTSWLYYGLEAGTQGGRGLGDDADQFDAELGLKRKKWRVGLGFAQAGADYIQHYPTAHKFLGFADIFGRRNISSLRAHMRASLGGGFGMRLDYHTFERVKDDVAPYKLNGSTAYANTVNSRNADLGSEVDLVVNYKFMGSSRLDFGAAFYEAGQFFKDQGGTDFDKGVQFFYLQLLTKF